MAPRFKRWSRIFARLGWAIVLTGASCDRGGKKESSEPGGVAVHAEPATTPSVPAPATTPTNTVVMPPDHLSDLRDYLPIALPDAPPGWATESSQGRPWRGTLESNLELIGMLEEGLQEVARPEDMNMGARTEHGRCDYVLFAPWSSMWAHPKSPFVRYAWRDYGDHWVVRRSWWVDLDGGRVELSISESSDYAAIRVRPNEWDGRDLEERLSWARWALPRLIQIRGLNVDLETRHEIDLRVIRVDGRRARLATQKMSGAKLWDVSVGEIDDGGVVLVFRRYTGMGPGFGC